ncbi:MAG: putative ABC-type uncharacterized transport system, periplasmic component [Microvirga sp.]|jgi:putative ABC transport system substrate-binding protein|nr:putative ABC-type uncharacterized transport system, periplasmic component [Microvirga sp.]
MRRREVIGGLLAGAALTRSFPALAQKTARIALLGGGTAQSSEIFVEALRQGLHENGLAESRDYDLDLRWAEGDYTRFPELVADVLQRNPSVMMANTIAAIRAAQRATTAVPIVMLHINDPVGNGLVASLARPGGNTTGLSNLNEDLTPKFIDIITAILPRARSIAAVFNPTNPSNRILFESARTQAASIGVTVRPAELPNAGALGSLFETLAQNPPDALLVLADVTLLDQRDAIAALGLRYGLPVISGYPEMTHAGALAGYGPPRREFYRRAATYVKKILDGTRPQDLPVEQPARIELSVNLKTARSLGITIPEFVLARADEVIE